MLAWPVAVLTENDVLNQALGNKLHTQRGWKAGLWHRQLFSAEAHPPPAGPAARICLWQCWMEGAKARHKDSFSTWVLCLLAKCVCAFPGFLLRKVQHGAACWRFGLGWEQSRCAQGRTRACLAKGLWASQGAAGEMRYRLREQHLPLSR